MANQIILSEKIKLLEVNLTERINQTILNQRIYKSYKDHPKK